MSEEEDHFTPYVSVKERGGLQLVELGRIWEEVEGKVGMLKDEDRIWTCSEQ